MSRSFSPPVTIFLWVVCEIAIAACDLAEVLGSAIALNLLFGLPLIWGVAVDQSTGLVYASDMTSGLWIVQPTNDALPT